MRFLVGTGIPSYDLSPAGERFLMMKYAHAATTEPETLTQVVLVQNWFEELTRLVPTDQ